jgi:serine/threonine-protein kinase SRPK3
LTEEALFEVLGTPEPDELVRYDGKPLDEGMASQLVKAASWEGWIEEDHEDLRILDLGEAFLKGTEPERLSQPPHLRAPETIFMDSFDSRHDLWRVGTMVRTFRLESFRY